MQMKGLSFLEAVELLAEQCGFQLEKGEINSYSSWKHASKLQKDYSHLNKNVAESLPALSSLPGLFEQGWGHVFKYLEYRGYPEYEKVKEFNIYPCVDPSRLLRIGFPAYDDLGNLVGVNARRMDTVLTYPDSAPKYRITSGYKAANVLYNLNIAKEFCRGRELILVEGELSCIRLHTYGIKNSVAMTGSKLSAAQAGLACKYATSLVFLVEEGDAAAKGTAASILEIHKLAPFIVPIFIATLRYGDADDNTKETITQALNNIRRISRQDILELQNQNYTCISRGSESRE
jgi:DNA primase